MPVVRLGLFKGGNLRGDRGKREAEHYGEEGMVRFHYSFKSQFQFAGAAGEVFSFEPHLIEHVHEEIAERRVALGVMRKLVSQLGQVGFTRES